MTLALALVLIGALMIYAGIKGKSLKALMLGDNTQESAPPAPVERQVGPK